MVKIYTGLDKNGYQVNSFFIFLTEALLMSTHNMEK